MNKRILLSWRDHEEEILDPTQALSALVECFGETDPEIRDELGYTIFSQLMAKGALPVGTLAALLERLTSGGQAFFHIGETADAAVLRRSFAWLGVAAVLERDQANPAPELSAGDLDRVLEALRRYLDQEIDWRGYHEAWGWVHAGAHVADAAAALTRHPNLTMASRTLLTAAAWQFVSRPLPWLNEEMDRWAWVFFCLIEQDSNSDEVDIHLNRFLVSRTRDVNTHRATQNVKSVLYTLYFLLRWSSRRIDELQRSRWLDRIEQRIAHCDIFVVSGYLTPPWEFNGTSP